MRSRSIPSDDCARACEWISLRLDSQLSEFEQVLLGAHLKHCPDCSAFEKTAAGLTGALRAAPLAEPTFAFELPRRRGARVVGLRAVSAAAAVAVVGISSFVGLHLSASHSPVAASVSPAVMGFKEQQMEELDNSTGQTTIQDVRPGVAAAEHLTVAPAPQTSVQPRRDSRPATGTATEGR